MGKRERGKEAERTGAGREPWYEEVREPVEKMKKVEEKMDVDHEEEDIGDPDIGDPTTAMEQDREVQRGFRRQRERDADEERAEELEGRLRSSMVGIVQVEGPPWYDSRSGELLDPKLVEEGMDRERESLGNFEALERAEDDEPGKCSRQPVDTGWVLADRGKTVKARLVAR